MTPSFSIKGGFTTFDMRHSGESNFQVELVDTSDGETWELLANEIGDWEGLYPLYVPEGDWVCDVTADGEWHINIDQPRDQPSNAEAPPVIGTDTFPNYLGLIEFSGYAVVEGRYTGDSNFIVEVLDLTGQRVGLLFNEIGEFEGETTFSGEGPGYIRVQATGGWEIEVRSG